MKRKSLKRQHDSLIIPEGIYAEEYTPVTGKIQSPGLGIYLEYVKFRLSDDADVTFVNLAGQLISAYPCAKGDHPFLVREIRIVSTGRCLILHDGVKKSTEGELNTAIYS